MYEYRGNNRFANCGYARIDNRNQILKLEIHMKVSSQTTEEPIHIYGCFQRDGQLYGVELGQHTPALGMVNWRTQCNAENLSDTDISFSDLEGLILQAQSPMSYCSIWNDQSIHPMDMIPYPSREADILSAAETEPLVSEAIPTVSSTDTVSQGLSVSPSSAESMVENDASYDHLSQPDTKAEDDPSAAFSQPAAEDKDSSTAAFSQPAVEDKDSSPAAFSQPAAENGDSSAAAFPQPAVEDKDSSPAAFSQPAAENGDSSTAVSPQTPVEPRAPLNTSSPSAISMPRTSPTLVERIIAQEYKKPDVGSFSKTSSTKSTDNTTIPSKTHLLSRWDRLTSQYPRVNIFSEGELKNCVRVEPKDFPVLRREGWNIAGNRFILHCFQRNAHCLIGRIGDTEQYIFAVPGIYDNQERFMANMFGFPCFKSLEQGSPLSIGQKGYWYRALR